MKAAVVPKVGGKWEVREIPMSLIVTAGCVPVQRGETRPGDGVWFSLVENHWHGAGGVSNGR
jgi:hypothetical protein